ncbi:PREDICTED: uncharacterized protein LOC107161724 [Diuraphis noxia]|uniref:uncharacterized protein LOC107161724 n=1 Tax=Diuraphis noxia TaxID=143948 RepID=UPI00076377F7|nr:PREDICTED: uncharacterized protein LOC107161724 [Diuraphis noxia]
MVRIMYSFLENPSSSLEFSHYYRPFYHRGTPFYAGLLAGIVVEELKKRKIKFSLSVVYAGTLVVCIVCIWVQLYGSVFYETYRPYNALEQSLYAAFSHCTWAFILFWITVCHFTSGYGPIEKLLNNRLTVPLGRLSYTVYLVNIIVIIMIESKQRNAVTPSSDMLMDGWIVGSLRTYFIGALLYLIIDAPFGLLIKQLLFRKARGHNDRVGTTTTPNEMNANCAETEQKNTSIL